ncbi:hypothetical protein EST38_g9736 [Candolleomyces aberdarensis]|uniref:DUF6697 domain-containing protein n=1 Tax=Candolleomyces aberdarensis TaxID=2316362 RepID=A0A4Q2DBD7_9AGAR|nr:hypothetical protein EST38_g9736 [Candolleomyces aberdarensis]
MDSDDSTGDKRYGPLVNTIDDDKQNEALCQLSRGLELLRDATPFRVVEMALEIQAEKMRVVEAMKARDAAVHRLLEAYTSVRRHSEVIEQLQKEREEHGLEKLGHSLSPPSESHDKRILELEEMIADLRDINLCLKEYGSYERKMLCDPPPHYEGEITRVSVGAQTEPEVPKAFCDPRIEPCRTMSAKAQDVAELIQVRNDMLAVIPLPENAPDISLVPITLPPQVTLHEFLNSAPASLRTELGNYRVFHSTTTTWCPEREEHGFTYVPMFKCNTNPRALTAHRWNAVDVIGRMSKPTECFYNHDGTWYYAGSYKAFYIDVVSTKEWEQFSPEATSAIIRETLAGRKSTTPQNNYETGQLYAAGALKLACIGLQCAGFNMDLYHSISDLATKFTQAKWKAAVAVNSSNSMSPSAGSASGSVVGTPPISSSSSLFSGIPSPHGSVGHIHTPHFHGHGSSLLPHPQSKVNSPLSPHVGSGPCTPNLPTSGVSTPGISPLGTSLVSGSSGGLGTGSPAWNISSNLRLKTAAMGLNATSTLGLQLSNISLSPGATSGLHPHHQLRSAGQSSSATAEDLENNENLAPAAVTRAGSPGLLAGMTLVGGSAHEGKMKIVQK